MEHQPLILKDGRVKQLAAYERIPLQHVPVLVERILSWSSNTPYRWQLMMAAGVVDYVLPALPSGSIEVQINGVGVNFTVSGVNLHITEYTPGTIDDTDELTVYYTGAEVLGSETIHEVVTDIDGEAVMAYAP